MPSFETVLAWAVHYGYAWLFVVAVIEAPLAAAAGAFAAALGYLDIWPVLILAYAADLLTDLIKYEIGRRGHMMLAERYGHRIGLTTERMRRIETFLTRHALKGYLATKFMPVVSTFAIFVLGAVRYPMRKFAAAAAIVIVPRVALYGGIGYFFGYAYESIERSITAAMVATVLAAILAGALYAAYRGALARFDAQSGPVRPPGTS